MLRFLLMLPGGNRTEGLARMLRARTRGRLLQGEADYQLQIIYLWYEHRTDLAVGHPAVAARALSRQPAVPRRISPRSRIVSARHHGEPRHAGGRCSRWRANSASTRRTSPRSQARLGIARQLDALCQTDHAHRAAARRSLTRSRRNRSARWPRRTSRSAKHEDRLGHRDAAVAAYRAAVNAVPAPGCRRRSASARRSGLQPRAGRRRAPRPTACRSRAFASSNDRTSPGAEAALTRSIALNPDDPRRALSLRARAAGADGRTVRRSRSSS